MKTDYSTEVSIKGRVWACLDLVKQYELRNKIIVDVGSSFGWLEKELLKLHPKKVIGIDPSKDAISYAQKSIKEAFFIEGNATSIPLNSNSVDFVLLFDVLEHLPKNQELASLSEIKRVLTKGGKLLLSTPNDNFFIDILDPAWYLGHRHYSVNKISQIIEQSGLSIENIYLRGDIFSSLYLIWLYFAKIITVGKNPESKFFEEFDDRGYKSGKIGTVFLAASKNE